MADLNRWLNEAPPSAWNVGNAYNFPKEKKSFKKIKKMKFLFNQFKDSCPFLKNSTMSHLRKLSSSARNKSKLAVSAEKCPVMASAMKTLKTQTRSVSSTLACPYATSTSVCPFADTVDAITCLGKGNPLKMPPSHASMYLSGNSLSYFIKFYNISRKS